MYVAAPRDGTVLSKIFSILKQYANEDRYIMASVEVLTGEMMKQYECDMSSASVRSCLETLRSLGYVEEHIVLAWDWRSKCISKTGKGGRAIFKLLREELDDSDIARYRSEAEENALLRKKVKELQDQLHAATQ